MTSTGEPRIPRIRQADIPGDAFLVVRGEDVDDLEVSVRQAGLFRRRYPDWGRFGLSGYYARSMDEVFDLGVDALERFPVLAVFRMSDLVAVGFEIVPTFRTPHVTIAFVDHPEQAYRRLQQIDHQRIVNPGHREERR